MDWDERPEGRRWRWLASLLAFPPFSQRPMSFQRCLPTVRCGRRPMSFEFPKAHPPKSHPVAALLLLLGLAVLGRPITPEVKWSFVLPKPCFPDYSLFGCEILHVRAFLTRALGVLSFTFTEFSVCSLRSIPIPMPGILNRGRFCTNPGGIRHRLESFWSVFVCLRF